MNVVVERARHLAPFLRARASEIESARRLPDDLAAVLADAGVFHLTVPAAYGGLEASPETFVDVLIELARGDGATAWCAMVGATTALTSGWFSPPVAHEVYGALPRRFTCGVFAPMGRATRAPGGYTLSGRWSFASGCELAAERLLGFVTDDPTPQVLHALVPDRDARVVDTWHALGLRGTGSHDVVVDGVLVPDERVISLLVGAPREPGPLYRFPFYGLLATGVAAVAVGLARESIDLTAAIAREKRPAGARRVMGERESTQVELGRAESLWRAARAVLREAIRDVWSRAASGEPLTIDERLSLRLAASQSTEHAAAVVDRMYRLAGTTPVQAQHPLQRVFRDVHVATQHLMAGDAAFLAAGRAALGITVDPTLL